MCKWKIITIAVLLSGSFTLYAETQIDQPSEVTVAEPVQEHIVAMMQENFIFENEHRKLANELALEELRSKISKLKSDSFGGNIMQPNDTFSDTKSISALASDTEPKVLLVSNIAGVSRVAVSIGSEIKMVPVNTILNAYGKKFKVYPAVDGGSIKVREITQ